MLCPQTYIEILTRRSHPIIALLFCLSTFVSKSFLLFIRIFPNLLSNSFETLHFHLDFRRICKLNTIKFRLKRISDCSQRKQIVFRLDENGWVCVVVIIMVVEWHKSTCICLFTHTLKKVIIAKLRQRRWQQINRNKPQKKHSWNQFNEKTHQWTNRMIIVHNLSSLSELWYWWIWNEVHVDF